MTSRILQQKSYRKAGKPSPRLSFRIERSPSFPASLSLFLNEEQIEAVKDGMTYGVVKVTYEATLDMIPSLKEEEKVQIYAWLVEAREFAMDAENSNKKHAAFGKYKGRINNYLAKRGYNLTKEREEWAKRVKARGGTL